MMNTVKKHYEQQLADVYSWMAGDFETVTERNRVFLRQLELDKLPRGLAIDLGAGPGFQSLPLAEFGFSVVAVDFSSALLAELCERAGHLPIKTIQDDILNFSKHTGEAAQVIVCMGDTLTHLESLDAVKTLLRDAAHFLAKDGKLILTFRDYVSTELSNEQRFIPVQADDSKIFTCFLEYHKDFVEVFDLLYRKENEQWKLSVSSYPKLRLDRNWVVNELLENKLSVVYNELANGMLKIVAEKSE